MIMYDIIIRNGLLYDGLGGEPRKANLAIKGRDIVRTGVEPLEGSLTIDASGMIVSPGFVDIHSHDEASLLSHGGVEAKARQGVTSVLLGNCGLGFFPLIPERESLWRDYHSSLYELQHLKLDWTDYQGFMKRLLSRGLTMNAGSLMGHGALRIAVMGSKTRRPTSKELRSMQEILAYSLHAGCAGLSTGLLYPPSSYAHEEEITALAMTLSENGGVYVTHLRNESDGLKKCIQENILLAQSTNVSVQISHLIVSGRRNWGLAPELLNLIKKAQSDGLSIHCDQYPYQAGITFITALLPQWSMYEGVEGLVNRLRKDKGFRKALREEIIQGTPGWDNIIKSTGSENIRINSVSSAKNQGLIGKSLREISLERQEDTIETLFSLLQEEEGRITVLIFSVSSQDLERILQEEDVMVGTDGIMINGRAHPRLYGTYPRIISRYVRERALLPLEKAIYKMAYLPAKKFGFKKRGLLQEGYRADIVIFDLERIADQASFLEPHLYPVGLEWVLVNGEIAFAKGEYSPKRGIGEILERDRV